MIEGKFIKEQSNLVTPNNVRIKTRKNAYSYIDAEFKNLSDTEFVITFEETNVLPRYISLRKDTIEMSSLDVMHTSTISDGVLLKDNSTGRKYYPKIYKKEHIKVLEFIGVDIPLKQL